MPRSTTPIRSPRQPANVPRTPVAGSVGRDGDPLDCPGTGGSDRLLHGGRRGPAGRLLGLVDEESDFWAAASAAGRFAVAALHPGHRQLADRFAGLFPAPGGLFATGSWTSTEYGPVPADATAWAGCRLDSSREYGWNLLVEATIEAVELVGDLPPLLHHRGRYRELAN